MRKNGGKDLSDENDSHPSGDTKTPPVSKGKVIEVGSTVPIKGGTGDAYQNPT